MPLCTHALAVEQVGARILSHAGSPRHVHYVHGGARSRGCSRSRSSISDYSNGRRSSGNSSNVGIGGIVIVGTIVVVVKVALVAVGRLLVLLMAVIVITAALVYVLVMFSVVSLMSFKMKHPLFFVLSNLLKGKLTPIPVSMRKAMVFF